MGLLQHKKKLQFDLATLKRNDIVSLTLDERWNRIFKIIPVSPGIKKLQDSLNSLLGKEASLYQEQQNIEPEKRKHMERIITLTQKAFEENDEKAKQMLTESGEKIETLNRRAKELEDELYNMKEKIREANFKLLEETVRYVYGFMSKYKKKEKQLDRELEVVKKRLKELQDKRQNLAADWTDVYAFFHTLLGPDELTKLDQMFLKSEVKEDEAGQPQRNENKLRISN